MIIIGLLFFAVALLCLAVMLLGAGVIKMDKALMCECLRLADEVSRLRHQMREAERRLQIAGLRVTPIRADGG
jgi:hypothetical protein